MLFGRAVFFYVSLISILGGLLVFSLVRVQPKNRELYAKVLKESSDIIHTKALERNPAYQKREEAQKDLWTFDGSERVHFRMHSEHSSLSLKQKKDKVEVIEEMEGISCALENPLLPISKNHHNLIQAKKGFYEYPSQHFVANQVECFHELGYLKAEKATFIPLKKKNSALEPSEGPGPIKDRDYFSTHSKTEVSFPNDNACVSKEKQNSLLALESGVYFKTEKEGRPFSIQSEEALCSLSSSKTFSISPKQNIEFLHRVVIQIANDIRALGGFATYHTGSLTLYPEIPQCHCSIAQKNQTLFATKILFDFVNEHIQCIHAQTTLPIENKPPIHIASEILFWEKQKEKIELKDEVHIEQEEGFSILSEYATVFLSPENKPRLIEVKGNVRLFSKQIQNKDSYALADQIQMVPENQTMILSSKAPQRVLFWQEGVTLSAPEIRIQKDPTTNELFVEGKGDIHFTFTLEERNIIDQFISKYL